MLVKRIIQNGNKPSGYILFHMILNKKGQLAKEIKKNILY